MARHFKGASLLAGRELIAVVLAFLMVVGGGSIAEAEMTRRENQAQQDAADRAAAAQTRLSLSDLVSEARLVTKTKAAYISEEYQAAYDAAKKNTAAGTTAAYTPPSSGFSAALPTATASMWWKTLTPIWWTKRRLLLSSSSITGRLKRGMPAGSS